MESFHRIITLQAMVQSLRGLHRIEGGCVVVLPILQEAPSFSSQNKRLIETLTLPTHHRPPPLRHNSGLTHQCTLLWKFRNHCTSPRFHYYSQEFLSCRMISYYRIQIAKIAEAALI